MSLQEYIDQFRRTLEKLQDFGLSEFFDFKQEIRPGKRAVINARVVLVNETILHIRAYINARYKTNIVSYAFQYQRKNGELIFRYDNAAHKPALEFKEHKHLENGTIIHASVHEPLNLIDEILELF